MIVEFASSVSLSQLRTSLVESMDKQQVIHSISTRLSYRYRGNTAYLFKNFPITAVITAVTAENRGNGYRVTV